MVVCSPPSASPPSLRTDTANPLGGIAPTLGLCLPTLVNLSGCQFYVWLNGERTASAGEPCSRKWTLCISLFSSPHGSRPQALLTAEPRPVSPTSWCQRSFQPSPGGIPKPPAQSLTILFWAQHSVSAAQALSPRPVSTYSQLRRYYYPCVACEQTEAWRGQAKGHKAQSL